MGADMSNNNNTNRLAFTKDFFSSPALSLTLAGIFRRGEVAEKGDVEMEEVDDGSGGARRDDTAAEVSSENSGPVRSRSDDDGFDGGGAHDENEDGMDHGCPVKRRKKYHRHTTEQIREMEALFKESPHPDEKQRQQLSKRLGLSPRQVKFWFQNRRTQIKAIQERHENTLLKAEMEKLREEIKGMREICRKKVGCPNCGTADAGEDHVAFTTTEQLRIKNAKLKAEVEKLRAALGKYPKAAASPSYSSGNEQETRKRSCLDFYTGIFGVEKSRMMEKVDEAVEELKTMATVGDPLWVRSVESGRQILNYDEYLKTFHFNNNNNSNTRSLKTHIEASRETALVFMDPSRLVQSFMDENQWKEMFPFMISKAATVDVICNGEAANLNNGAVQLMFAEVQMLTPLVPTREMYFIRHCKQLDAEQWAIVDVSIENIEDNNNIDASLVKYRKRPSGCIIKDESNGHCKVTMVEHLECEKNKVHNLYRNIVNNGTAFGARHWMATLQLQCERLAFFMATNIPMKDSIGVATLAGRKSTLKLAQRMSSSFSQAIAASSYQTWTKVVGKTGEDIRVCSRKNLSDPGEPIGVILCAVSSLWLPLSPHLLFDFFRDESRRNQWDAMFGGDKVKSIANLAKGQDRGNSVTIQTIGSKESNNMWILQDSSTNSSESMVVYSGVDISSMQSVMSGCDSGSVAILPSGFSILPDGADSRPPLLITRRKDDKASDNHGGVLLTAAVQILTDTSPSAKPTMESIEYVKSIICCTLKNIRTSMCCEDD